MGAMASQSTSLTIVYSTVKSEADQRKQQSSASLAFVRGIHRGPVNSPHKWPVTRKMFPFDDVIMPYLYLCTLLSSQWSRAHLELCRFEIDEIDEYLIHVGTANASASIVLSEIIIYKRRLTLVCFFHRTYPRFLLVQRGWSTFTTTTLIRWCLTDIKVWLD